MPGTQPNNPSAPLPTRIFLIGFMGSGKSSVGACLAFWMGYRFADTDQRLEAALGRTIADIFDKEGEAYFRKEEKNILQATLNEEKIVVSTGGGIPCFEDNMETMLRNGWVVYLRNQPLTLVGRLEHERQKRPLLRGKDLLPYITEGIREREKYYNKAHYIIDCDNKSVSLIGTTLFRHLSRMNIL